MMPRGIQIRIVEADGSVMNKGRFGFLNDAYARQEMKQRLSVLRAWTGKG